MGRSIDDQTRFRDGEQNQGYLEEGGGGEPGRIPSTDGEEGGKWREHQREIRRETNEKTKTMNQTTRRGGKRTRGLSTRGRGEIE